MNNSGIFFSLGAYRSAVEDALETMGRDNIIARIWDGDHTVWKPASDKVTNRLGWLDAPEEILKKTDYVRQVLQPFTGGSIKEVVLIGMGGSSLAADVFGKIFGSHKRYPHLQVLDTTDPAIISSVSQRLDWEETLFVVSSKSGTTLEVTSLFQYFYNLTFKKLDNTAGNHFIFITDEGSPMMKIAEKLSLYHTFLNNPHIGGRYSALSFPGIVPAAIIGVDVKRLLQKAIDVAQTEKTQSMSEKLNASGASLGAVLGTLAQMGRDKLSIIMPPRWKSFGDWLEQLIAESTGKENKGMLPVLNEPPAQVQAYGKDRVFVTFQNNENDNTPKVKELIAAEYPVITIKINDNYDLGGQMFIWEMAVAVAAHFLGVNPFDQPDVEATKAHTRLMIAQYGKTKVLPQQAPALVTPECSIYGDFKGSSAVKALAGFLNKAKAGDYVCLQVFLSPSSEIDAVLAELRKTIFLKYGLAVTCGYGPRYLHSTGQLHKGDSGNGLFIQLTANDLVDVDIPDQIGVSDSTLTFGMLKAAQAQGDWQALIDKGRRIIRLHCKKDYAVALRNLTLSL